MMDDIETRGDRRMSIMDADTPRNNSSNDTGTTTPPTKPLLGLAIAGTTILGTLALTAPFVLQYIRSPLPYMATPKHKVKRALEFIAQLERRQSPTNQRHFVDMGSGDGEAVYQALQIRNKSGGNYYTTATGIELNSTLWGLAQVRRLFWRKERPRSSFRCQDMFQFDLSHPDTVMIFGVPPLMIRVSQKLAAECSEGTLVLAYRFPVPLGGSEENATEDTTTKEESIAVTDNTVITKEEARLLVAKLIYEEEEMRIYECRSLAKKDDDSSSSSQTMQ